MGLETGNTIAELVETNPTAEDLRNEGDAHIRLIKAVLKNDVVPSAQAALKSEITLTALGLENVDNTADVDKPVSTAAFAEFGKHWNRAVNGAMEVDQTNNGAAQTFTAGAAKAYCIDQFYGSCTGANVTGQQVAGSGAHRKQYQFTGAASVTGIIFGQPIESVHVYDLVSKTATFSVDLANSLLTSVTWTAYYANSADNFSAKTQIATGTFTVSSTLARYSAQIAMGANAGNGVAIELSVGAQTSGTWTIGDFKLEEGSTATQFEHSYDLDQWRCWRYYFRDTPDVVNYFLGICWTGSTTLAYVPVKFPRKMRTKPTTLQQSGTATDYEVYTAASGTVACSAVPVLNSSTPHVGQAAFTVASGLTANQTGMGRAATTSGYLGWSARMSV